METGSQLENNNMDMTKHANDPAISSPLSPPRRYLCEICDKTFSTSSVRERHVRIHTGEKRFACHYSGCTKRFARHDYLRNHWRTHEDILGHDFASLPPKGVTYLADDDDASALDSIDMDIVLQDADQALEDSDALRYQAVHAGKFPCHYCEKIYEREDCRKRHSRIHTGDKQYVCHVSGCGMAFYRADHLTGHLKTHGSADRSPHGSIPTEETKELSTIPNAKSSAFTSHDSDVAKLSSQPAFATSNISHSERRTTTHGTFLVTDIECDLCGELFSRPADKKRHILSAHVDQKPWICLQSDCGGCFATRDALIGHEHSHREHSNTATHGQQNTAHNAISKHIMPDEPISIAAALIKQVHDREFPCQHEGCDEVFKGPAKLLEHQKDHNDPRPFKCPICGKGLSRKNKLTVHIRLHDEQKQAIDVPPSAPAAMATLSRGDTPIATPPLGSNPRPRGRPPLLQPGQHHVCHLCGKKFGRSTDLKRHLASSVHQSSESGANGRSSLQPKLYVPRNYPCTQCGKAFGRKADRDRHMASPNVHANVPTIHDSWREYQPSDERVISYAQECVGCGQTFVDEKSFYSHAPCYRSAAADEEPLSSEDDGDVGREEEDPVVQSSALLDDFEAQLLAAANDGPSRETRAYEKYRSAVRNMVTSDTSARRDASVQSQTKAHNSGLSDEVKQRVRTLAGAAATNLAITKSEETSHPGLADSTPIAVRKADEGQLREPSAQQHSRLCYGCVKVLWDSKGFWMHSPCFTTSAQSTSATAPLTSTSTMPLNTHTLPKAGLHSSSTIDKHDSISPSTKPALAQSVAEQGNGQDYLEKVVGIAPSPEVQRLLINLAKNNPDARPIPPEEFHRLTHREPDMLALVTKMKKDNAELQVWLKKHQNGRTSQTSSKVYQTPVSEPAQKPDSHVRWTCKVREETLADIYCYAKPGEDLDWTKIADRTERTRVQNIIKTRRRRERELYEQGQAGSGGDYPGAEGVRGFLSKSSGPEEQLLDKRIRKNDTSNALKRKIRHDAALETESKYFVKAPAQISQQHSLRTSTGLRLRDATDHDYERFIEDDEP